MSSQDPQGADPLARHTLSATELKQLLALERAGEAFIAYRNGHGALRFFTPTDADRAPASNISIGRRSGMDLSLAWDSEVSGLHAELHRTGGEWMIVDDGLSTNGTYVNGRRINARRRLKDADRIRVGRTVLAYKAAQATLVGETVAAAELPVIELTDTQRKVLIALCRPCRDGHLAAAATNHDVAAELHLSVDAVKMHLRTLFAKFQLGGLPQNQKRLKLVERALQLGTVSRQELA